MQFNSPDRERPAKFTDIHEPWERLSAAIIKTACVDYKFSSYKRRNAIERFIRSTYFNNISTINPEWMIKNLRIQYRPTVVQ